MARKLKDGVRKQSKFLDRYGFEFLLETAVRDDRVTVYLINPEGETWGETPFPTVKDALGFHKFTLKDPIKHWQL
jgi:hypothetical protein